MASTKKKRVLTEEHKAKMKAGREEAAARRRQEARETEESGAPPDSGLLRTSSAEIRKIQETRSLEDIARRHTEDDEDPDEEYPSLEEVAHRTDVYTANDDVAPEEPNPLMRRAPTMGRVLREDGDGELTNFKDVMSEYGQAIELGIAHIDVTRKSPPQIDGLRIKGIQRPITRQMTQTEFCEFYGGGDYELIVYGPSQSGGHRYDPVTGAVINRKLTKPIPFQVPLGLYAPNPEAALQEDEYMNRHPGTHPGPNFPLSRFSRSTPADAKIHETDVMAEERREERQRMDQKEREREERKRQQEEERKNNQLFEQLAESHREQMRQLREYSERQMDMITEQLQTARAEAAQLRQELTEEKNKEPKRSDGELLVTSLGQLLPAFKSNLDPEQRQQIESAASKDRERMLEAHQRELQHLQERHQDELKRLHDAANDERRRSEDRERSIQRDVDQRISEAREGAEKRVREVEERAEKLVAAERRDCEQRIQDTDRAHEARVKDIERYHASEMRQLKESHDTRLQSIQSQHASEMHLKESEIARLRELLAKAEEKANRPLHEQLTEFSETAEAMGFSKSDGDEPKDWKSMLSEGGMAALQRLPELLETAGSLFNARRAVPPGAPPPRQLPGGAPAAQHHVPEQVPLAFATEDGPGMEFADMGPPPRPVYPEPPPPQESAPPPARPPAPAPAPTPAPTPAPAASQPQQPQQPRPNPPPQVSAQMIVDQAAPFEAAFEQGGTPVEFVEQAIAQYGVDTVRQLVEMISPELLIEALEEHKPESSLVNREGQKFLKEVWARARGAVGHAGR